MRVKDDKKKQAIISATIDLVNEIGFASSSVSKIAKRANVSPATIYIYYKNKEDLLVSTYVDIKTCLGDALMAKFDASLPVEEALMNTGVNLFDYISENAELFYFTEQFANSPYNDLVDKAKIEGAFLPLFDVIQQGINDKVIKDVNFELIFSHLYYPIFGLANPRLNPDFRATPENVRAVMSMAWDAIKL